MYVYIYTYVRYTYICDIHISPLFLQIIIKFHVNILFKQKCIYMYIITYYQYIIIIIAL